MGGGGGEAIKKLGPGCNTGGKRMETGKGEEL